MSISNFRKVLSKFGSSDVLTGLILAVIVGVIAGLGAVAFRWLILSFQDIFFSGGGRILSFLGKYYVVVIPAAGGLVVGPLIYFFAREAKGHGVPEVMEAVYLRGGRIRPRVALVKSLASSLCIGSGGSVGREGPIVQIGASAGSAIGQWLKLPDETVKTLVACGAAGGISATFNAPIAGVFFALEVIIGRMVTHRLTYVVISSVIADFVAHSFLGNERAFTVPQFGLSSPLELGFYALLGVLAALAATLFIKVLYWGEDAFSKLSFPEYLKPVLGGLVIGAMGLFDARLFGVGYDGIQAALGGQLGIGLLLGLLLMKIVATTVTVGSGGSGGVFAPSLFIGAMLGTAVGMAVDYLFPTLVISPAAYGVVAMAAVFAGAARAPFSAILIIFEMTGSYSIILPVMTSVVISFAVSRIIQKESIYTLKLVRRGVFIGTEEVSDIMKSITVAEAMTTGFPTVSPQTPVKELISLFQRRSHHGFPVVDESGQLLGIVTLTDVERYMGTDIDSQTAIDIATRSPYVAYPDQTLDKVLSSAEEEYGRIPVVGRDDGKRLVGVLRRQDIIKSYRKKKRSGTVKR